MDASIRSAAPASRLPKARRSSRSPVLFASVELGKAFRGFILNASEGGLCVQAAQEITEDGPLELRFQSVQAGAWVDAIGRVAWRNETRTVAGIEFIDQTPEVTQEIKKWLSFGASLQELRGTWEADEPAMGRALADWDLFDHSVSEEPANATTAGFPVAENATDAVPLQRGLFDAERRNGGGSLSLRTLSLAALAIFGLLLLAFFGMRHGAARSMRSAGSGEETSSNASVEAPKTESAAENNAASSPSVSPPPAPSPSVSPPPAPSPSVSPAPAAPLIEHASVPSAADASGPTNKTASGPTSAAPSTSDKKNLAAIAPAKSAEAGSQFVLQAGAMSDEQNAKELADSLRQKNYPAFVSKRNKFYRVFVGPYATQESLRQAKGALHKDSFDTIATTWPASSTSPSSPDTAH